eukprot:365803-Chlamydomonas_euryale.AAC.16
MQRAHGREQAWHDVLSRCDPHTARMRLGMLPSSAITCNRATASVLPTTSLSTCGRYFSSCGHSG